MNARALAALARFDSETRRPLYDRDPEVLRASLARLSSKTRRDLAAEVAAYLRQNPKASADEVCREVGGRKTDVLALVRAARSVRGGDGNRPGGRVVPQVPDQPPESALATGTRFPLAEPPGVQL